MNRKIFITTILVCTLSWLVAQKTAVPLVGGQLGLSFSFGTHVQRIGLMGRFFFQYDIVQLNIQSTRVYNFYSLGSNKKGWEGHLQVGLAGCWGKRRDSIPDIHPYMLPTGNQTARPYSISYGYIYYFDKFRTRQWSGMIGFQVKDFRFYFENDFLAFQSYDKYRTGGMGFYYRVGDWQFSLKNIGYTGDPYWYFCPWLEDKHFPARNGFIDMTEAPYGNKSMGVLALQVERRLPLHDWLKSPVPAFLTDQFVGVEIGIDAEQIRNFLQNKLIHDSRVLPINWGGIKNPHVPMLCDDGCPYTYHPGQKIRKPKFYFQTTLNNAVVY